MAIEVQIPKLGLTMTEGTILRWEVQPGSEVSEGQAVFMMETDKVEQEVESPGAGRFHPVVEAGGTYECGVVIGYLLAEGEEPPAGAEPSTPTAGTPADQAAPSSAAETAAAPTPEAPTSGSRVLSSPNARRVAAELGVDLATVTGTGPGGRIVSEDVEAAAAAPPAPPAPPAPSAPPAPAAPATATGPLSPVVRRRAAELGVDLASITGTGVGGRITRADVEAAATDGAPRSSDAGPRPGDTMPLTPMRKVIAERMHSSLQQMAQLTLNRDIDMGAAVQLRNQLTAQWGPTGIRVPGYTDLIIKAAALALREHPQVNSRLTESGIELMPAINIGMAVSVPGGLIVPVIGDADCLPLDALATESARLATAARDGKLTLAEMEGGTFSVTALGMFDVDHFTPIINPPNVAILGVGAIRDELARVEGEIVDVKRMTVSLTIDHRVVDGAPGAEYLQTLAALLENPLRLLMG